MYIFNKLKMNIKPRDKVKSSQSIDAVTSDLYTCYRRSLATKN